MSHITETTRLERVEHLLGSGTGMIDFAIKGEPEYLTWQGTERDNWEIVDVERVENADEDRFLIYPEKDYFTCEVDVDRGIVRCWCEM